MTSYSEAELRLIAAAKKSLAEDKEKARRLRMLESGLDPAEVDRRIAQSHASRQAHLRVIADPERFEEFARLSKAQSDAARRSAGTSDRLAPDRTPECERRTLTYLREHGASPAIEVARAVSGDTSATKAYINPTLYRLAARGEVTLTERGWAVNHGALKAQILDFLDDTGHNALELAALLGVGIERTRDALDELVCDGALATAQFSTPSGEHTYYSKLLD